MSLNWKHVARDVVIIFILTAIGGFVVGLLSGMGISLGNDITIGVAISNLILICAGFAYSSYKTSEHRWAHLVAVGAGVWLLSLVNVIGGFATVGEWLVGIIPMIIFVGIGGGIGIFFANRKKKSTPLY